MAEIKYENGDVYNGDVLGVMKHGEGKMVYANGDVYEGEWSSDKKSGEGKMVYVNGDVYEGGWFIDKKSGKGRMVYANGVVYEGWWSLDRKSGKGRMVYANGEVYDGEWDEDEKHGVGITRYANGSSDEVIEENENAPIENEPLKSAACEISHGASILTSLPILYLPTSNKTPKLLRSLRIKPRATFNFRGLFFFIYTSKLLCHK